MPTAPMFASIVSASVVVAAGMQRRAAGGVVSKPNILYLMTDSMDGRLVDDASPLSEVVDMPFLRGFLAKNGANFVHSYSPSPMCVPARTSMMTGRSPDRNNIYGNRQGIAASPSGVLDDQCVKENGKERCTKWAEEQGYPETIFSAFKSLGYNVHMDGRLHVGAGMLNKEMHDDMVDGSQTCNTFDGARLGEISRAADVRKPIRPKTAIFTTKAVDNMTQDTGFGVADWFAVDGCKRWVENLPSLDVATQPFFLHCSLNLPHFAYATNSTWLASVHEDKITMPVWLPGFPDAWHPYDSFMSLVKGVDLDFTKEQVMKLRRIYYGMCAESDAMLRRIWEALEAKGYSLDNTYVLYNSDHGEMAFEHRQIEKASLYEGSARIPMQLAGPGIPKGQRMEHMTTLLDVFPTLLDMAQETNWEPHSGLMGRSLLSAAKGNSVAPKSFQLSPQDDRDFAFSQYNWVEANTGAFMVRSGKWKLITFGHTYQAFAKYPPQLFDLDADPDELNDVAATNVEAVATLDAKLRQVLDPDEVDRRVMKMDFEYLVTRYNHGAIRKALSGEDATALDILVGLATGGQPQEKAKFENWIKEAQNMFGSSELTPVVEH